MRKYKSLVALLILGVTACGQKGPLYYPDVEKLRNKVESTSETTENKNEEKTLTSRSSEQSGS